MKQINRSQVLRAYHVVIILLVSLSPLCSAQDGQCGNRIAKLTQQADTVVLAQVTEAGPAPWYWSGFATAQQTVTYRVDTVLKGNFNKSSFNVSYYVVHGSRLSEKNTPELNRALFKAGNKLLLFLHSRILQLPNGTERLLVNAVDDCSALPASEAAMKAVRNAAGK